MTFHNDLSMNNVSPIGDGRLYENIMTIEYLINIAHFGFDSFLNDSRAKSAGIKTNCSIELTSRTLNKRVNLYRWIKYAIVRITGPDEGSIKQCLRLLEKTFPIFQHRKEYCRKANVTIFTNDDEPDNMPGNTPITRSGPTLPMFKGLRVKSPFETDDDKHAIGNTPWKIKKDEKVGYYVLTKGKFSQPENSYKYSYKSEKNEIFGQAISFDKHKPPFSYSDFPLELQHGYDYIDNRCKPKPNRSSRINSKSGRKSDISFDSKNMEPSPVERLDSKNLKLHKTVSDVKLNPISEHSEILPEKSTIKDNKIYLSESSTKKKFSEKQSFSTLSSSYIPEPQQKSGIVMMKEEISNSQEPKNDILTERASISRHAQPNYVVNSAENIEKSIPSSKEKISLKSKTSLVNEKSSQNTQDNSIGQQVMSSVQQLSGVEDKTMDSSLKSKTVDLENEGKSKSLGNEDIDDENVENDNDIAYQTTVKDNLNNEVIPNTTIVNLSENLSFTTNENQELRSINKEKENAVRLSKTNSEMRIIQDEIKPLMNADLLVNKSSLDLIPSSIKNEVKTSKTHSIVSSNQNIGSKIEDIDVIEPLNVQREVEESVDSKILHYAKSQDRKSSTKSLNDQDVNEMDKLMETIGSSLEKRILSDDQMSGDLLVGIIKNNLEKSISKEELINDDILKEAIINSLKTPTLSDDHVSESKLMEMIKTSTSNVIPDHSSITNEVNNLINTIRLSTNVSGINDESDNKDKSVENIRNSLTKLMSSEAPINEERLIESIRSSLRKASSGEASINEKDLVENIRSSLKKISSSEVPINEDKLVERRSSLLKDVYGEGNVRNSLKRFSFSEPPINEEKLVGDRRSSLQKVESVEASINEENLVDNIRSSLKRISSSEVPINEDKLVESIRSSLRKAASGEASINEKDLVDNIRSSLKRISSSEVPINEDKLVESIRSSLRKAASGEASINEKDLVDNIRSSLKMISSSEVPINEDKLVESIRSSLRKATSGEASINKENLVENRSSLKRNSSDEVLNNEENLVENIRNSLKRISSRLTSINEGNVVESNRSSLRKAESSEVPINEKDLVENIRSSLKRISSSEVPINEDKLIESIRSSLRKAGSSESSINKENLFENVVSSLKSSDMNESRSVDIKLVKGNRGNLENDSSYNEPINEDNSVENFKGILRNSILEETLVDSKLMSDRNNFRKSLPNEQGVNEDQFLDNLKYNFKNVSVDSPPHEIRVMESKRSSLKKDPISNIPPIEERFSEIGRSNLKKIVSVDSPTREIRITDSSRASLNKIDGLHLKEHFGDNYEKPISNVEPPINDKMVGSFRSSAKTLTPKQEIYENELVEIIVTSIKKVTKNQEPGNSLGPSIYSSKSATETNNDFNKLIDDIRSSFKTSNKNQESNDLNKIMESVRNSFKNPSLNQESNNDLDKLVDIVRDSFKTPSHDQVSNHDIDKIMDGIRSSFKTSTQNENSKNDIDKLVDTIKNSFKISNPMNKSKTDEDVNSYKKSFHDQDTINNDPVKLSSANNLQSSVNVRQELIEDKMILSNRTISNKLINYEDETTEEDKQTITKKMNFQKIVTDKNPLIEDVTSIKLIESSPGLKHKSNGKRPISDYEPIYKEENLENDSGAKLSITSSSLRNTQTDDKHKNDEDAEGIKPASHEKLLPIEEKQSSSSNYTGNSKEHIDGQEVKGVSKATSNSNEKTDADVVYLDGLSSKPGRKSSKNLESFDANNACNPFDIIDEIGNSLYNHSNDNLILLFNGFDIYSSGTMNMCFKPKVYGNSSQKQNILQSEIIQHPFANNDGKFMFESKRYSIAASCRAVVNNNDIPEPTMNN